jgi:D-glycero-alpha-D-manno-heptose-7-phosphate kinase
MRKAGINGGVEVTVLSDIPHTGSGLGSSSTLTVGLLNAFYTYIGEEVSVETLAQEACEIEIQVLGKPIGKQDQYIAAYGGLRIISFKTDGSVQAEHVNGEYDIYNAMQKHSLLFYTGVGRKAECILAEQSRLITDTRPILRKMRDQVAAARDIIAAGNIGNLGELLKEGWKMKIQLADGISNSRISQMIERAIDAGASGAKITGFGEEEAFFWFFASRRRKT